MIDTIFLGSCLHICAHFDILRESFDGDIPKFVKAHEILIGLVDTLNDLIRNIMFTQFLMSSMLICALGFQLMMFESFFKRWVAMIYGTTILVQLFIYSLGGQLITNKSSTVAENLYQMNKDVLIIIARVQIPLSISAWFYNADFETYQFIVNSAYSFFSVFTSLAA